MQPVFAAHQANIMPHQVADGLHVALHQRGVGVVNQPSIIPGGHFALVRQRRVALLADILRSAVPPQQSFEQRSARQPIGAVQAGAGHLANSVQTRQCRPPPQIHQHTAAKIMRRGDDGDRPFGDVNIHLQAAGVNLGKALADGIGLHVRGDIQQHIRIPVFEHLPVNRAGDHVPGGQVFPLRVMARHERLSLRGE